MPEEEAADRLTVALDIEAIGGRIQSTLPEASRSPGWRGHAFALLCFLHAAYWVLKRPGDPPQVPNFQDSNSRTKAYLARYLGDGLSALLKRRGMGEKTLIRFDDEALGAKCQFVITVDGKKVPHSRWLRLLGEATLFVHEKKEDLFSPAKIQKLNPKLFEACRQYTAAPEASENPEDGPVRAPEPEPAPPSTAGEPIQAPELEAGPNVDRDSIDADPQIRKSARPSRVGPRVRSGVRALGFVLAGAVALALLYSLRPPTKSLAGPMAQASGQPAAASSRASTPRVQAAAKPAASQQPNGGVPTYTLYARTAEPRPATTYAAWAELLAKELNSEGRIRLEVEGRDAETNAIGVAANEDSFALVEGITPLRGFPVPLAQLYVERLHIVFPCNEVKERFPKLRELMAAPNPPWACPPLVVGPGDSPGSKAVGEFLRTVFEKGWFAAGEPSKSANLHVGPLSELVGGPPEPKGHAINFGEALDGFQTRSDMLLAMMMSGPDRRAKQSANRLGVVAFRPESFAALRSHYPRDIQRGLIAVSHALPGLPGLVTPGVPAVLVAHRNVPAWVRSLLTQAICRLKMPVDDGQVPTDLKFYEGSELVAADQAEACRR